MQANNSIDILAAVIQSVERLLKVLAKLYEGFSSSGSNIHSKNGDLDSSSSVSTRDSHPVHSRTSMIIDMELDLNILPKDTDSVNIGGKATGDILVSSVNQRMEVVLIISKLFSDLPFHTWDVMFELLEKESDPRVLKLIIHYLCQHPHWSSSRKFLNLIKSLNDFLDIQTNLKVQSLNVLAAICSLLESVICEVHKEDSVFSGRLSEEKFDVVTCYRINDGGLSFFGDIALVLIDEVHLLNDPRGAALEAIVSRIKMLSRAPELKSSALANVRFLAVSATIPNTDDLAERFMVPRQGVKRIHSGEE